MNIVDYFTPADESKRSKIISELKRDYPFISSFSIGKSSVLLLGGVHGSEWITSSLLLVFARRLCGASVGNINLPEITGKNFLKNFSVTIVPCLNPDGVEIAINGCGSAGEYKEAVQRLQNRGIWQANAAGVDLNHNFPADWQQLHRLEIKNGITSPSNTRYGGKRPASEPETNAVMKLCAESKFRHALAFHSQGEEIYWRYGNNIPDKSEQIAMALSKSCGYKLSEPQGLAVGGGFKDWFILKYNKPAFTVEVGLGKSPLPADDLPKIYFRLEHMLTLSVTL